MTNEEKQALIEHAKTWIANCEAIRDEIPFGLDSEAENELSLIKIALATLTAPPFDWQQRAEAAEAELETENKWRDLALQFDGHRMQAISLLKMIVNDAPEKQFTSVRNFLKCGPLSGEEVMNERLLFIANSRPAPAVSLAELNVRRDAIRYRFLRESDFFGADNEPGLASWDELSELDCNEFDAAVDARMNHPDSLYPIILRNIEEANK